MLDKGTLRDKRGKGIRGDEVVVYALDFSGTRIARGVGYAKCEGARVCVKELLG